jgi:hypothetical protein
VISSLAMEKVVLRVPTLNASFFRPAEQQVALGNIALNSWIPWGSEKTGMYHWDLYQNLGTAYNQSRSQTDYGVFCNAVREIP